VNYGYRYYNPSTGRWLNRDPLAEHDGPSLYCFVKNTPVANYDRDGQVILPGGGEPKPVDCSNACNEAKQRFINGGDAAGIVCCGG
jgi:hypothetical protein